MDIFPIWQNIFYDFSSQQPTVGAKTASGNNMKIENKTHPSKKQGDLNKHVTDSCSRGEMAAGLSKTVLQMKLEQKINSQSELTG